MDINCFLGEQQLSGIIQLYLNFHEINEKLPKAKEIVEQENEKIRPEEKNENEEKELPAKRKKSQSKSQGKKKKQKTTQTNLLNFFKPSGKGSKKKR